VLEVQRRGRLVTIRTQMPGDLPAFCADRDMVTIIIRNLLANAIKFSHQGGEVLVAFDNSPEHLVLEVTDHGMGIPEEVMPHLFQKFYRSQAAAEMGIEGTGLGLVLTKQAVEAHGGVIEVESEPGVRTTFTVRLPWR
jgi:signal transduction histidine kinase